MCASINTCMQAQIAVVGFASIALVLYNCLNTYSYVDIYINKLVHMDGGAYISIFTHICISIRICIDICVCICMCVRTYIYMCTKCTRTCPQTHQQLHTCTKHLKTHVFHLNPPPPPPPLLDCLPTTAESLHLLLRL